VSHLPRFQAQNPAISGYRYGWVSCTAFATAMVIDATTGGVKTPTGGKVRSLTDEPVPDRKSPGLSLAQVDEAANDLGVDLATFYRMDWNKFVSIRATHRPYVIAVVYAPIADSRFDAGHGFRGNHALAGVDQVILDPLADGRYAGVYKYHAEDYPDALIRKAAEAYPSGLQVAFAPAAEHPNLDWQAIATAGQAFTRYLVKPNDSGKLQIYGRKPWRSKSGFHLDCTKPTLVYENAAPGTIPSRRSLVRIAEGSYSGWWVSSSMAHPK